MLRKLATRALKLLGLHPGPPQEEPSSLEVRGQQSDEAPLKAHEPVGEEERGARVKVDDLNVTLSAEDELDQSLDQSVDLDELSLELSLDHEQSLFQLALSDPLRFLKEHGAEDQALAFEARKEAVKRRSAQRTPLSSRAEITGQEGQEGQEGQRHPDELSLAPLPPAPEVPSLADQAERGARTLRPPREPQKIKKPKKAKQPKATKKATAQKTKSPKPTQRELKGSGGDVARLSQAGSELPLNATEQSYSLSRVAQRHRGPSRYAGQGALDTTAASARAAIVQGIVESLDELIMMHREGLARREAFFESIQDLIESKQLCYTEADAWWFQLNRVTAHFDEQRVMRQAASPALEGAFKRHAQRAPLPASRSARRQAQRVQVQEGVVQIRFDALPSDFAPLHEPPPAPQSQGGVAKRKRHRHQGDARLFSSSIPQTNVHTLTSYDGEGSLEASLSLDQGKGR